MSNAVVRRRIAQQQISTQKLFTPPEFSGAIPRKGLLDRVFAPNIHIVALQAPAGHGKSTLLQQAKTECERRDMATGWLSFDETDNDINRLFGHLQALLENVEATGQRQPGDAQRDPLPTARTGGGDSARSDWFVSRLLRMDRPVALFLDEFQALHKKSVLNFFRNLLDRLPDSARLFIGSRTLPEVGLARLAVQQQALILQAEDLRFTPEEVGEFFAGAIDLDVNDDEVEAIYGRTEGWPAALQLYRLSLARPAVRESLGNLESFHPSQLTDYLAENVLAMQSPEIQDFLLRTSLFNRLCAELCDAVLDRQDSQKLLKQLESSGLFLRSLDSGLRWFKYHTLFSSFLRDQLRELHAPLIPELNRRACAWYLEAEMYEEALPHALAIRDFETAGQALDEWASQLIMDGQLMTLEHWYERLPLDVLAGKPNLTLKVAYALAFLRRRQKLGPILKLLDHNEDPQQAHSHLAVRGQIVRAMVDVIQDNLEAAARGVEPLAVEDQSVDGFTAFEFAAAANLKGFVALSAADFEGAREYLSLARAHGERVQATFSWAYSISTAGVNLLVQGRLREALELFRRGMSEPRISLDESVASAALVSCYVHALYQAHEIDSAAALFAQFHDHIANAALLDYLAVAYIAMARIHDAQGKPGQAQELLDEAEALAHSSLWPRLLQRIGWERVRRALVQGELDRAQAIASRIEAAGHSDSGRLPFSEDIDDETVHGIRLAIHDGKPEQALSSIRGALARAQAQGRVRRQMKLLTLAALAQAETGSKKQSQGSLRKALQLAAAEGFYSNFLEEGPRLLRLVQTGRDALCRGAAARDAATLPAFIKQLLEYAGPEYGSAGSNRYTQPLEPLTDREQEILGLVASGLANKDIAKKVFVSENTVKYHLKNVYAKLCVSSRLQATSAARELGLLH